VARQYGYEITQHRLLLYGVCPKCRTHTHPKTFSKKKLKKLPKTSARDPRHAKH
jgi:hypothetical protein